MDSQKVDLFLAANQKFFSPMQILTIKDRLLALMMIALPSSMRWITRTPR